MYKLSVKMVAALKEPGRYADGGGLYLNVSKTGSKSWVVRTMINGARRHIGAGSVRFVSLAEARETAYEIVKKARMGDDPSRERRNQRNEERLNGDVMTFAQAAQHVYDTQKLPTTRSPLKAQQWINVLKNHAFKVIGDRPVADIKSDEILKVLQPIWVKKAPTAERLLRCMRETFEWAMVAMHRTDPNPTEGVRKALPKNNKEAKHFKALPYQKVPDLLQLLTIDRGVSAMALKFTVLTGVRTAEASYAPWSEFDLENRIWTIPAERMKNSKEHIVPLSDAAMEVLMTMRSFDLKWVFPSVQKGKHISGQAMLEMSKERWS